MSFKFAWYSLFSCRRFSSCSMCCSEVILDPLLIWHLSYMFIQFHLKFYTLLIDYSYVLSLIQTGNSTFFGQFVSIFTNMVGITFLVDSCLHFNMGDIIYLIENCSIVNHTVFQFKYCCCCCYSCSCCCSCCCYCCCSCCCSCSISSLSPQPFKN